MFGRFVPGASEAHVISAAPWSDAFGDAERPTWAGPAVTSRSSLQLLTVYGCVRFIADGIATLPADVYRKQGGEAMPITAPPWLEQPTAELDRVAWTTQVLTSLLLAGNAYCWKRYGAEGRLAELVPLDPAAVSVMRVSGRKTFVLSAGMTDSTDILHIAGPMFPGTDVGLAPVEAARQSIGLGLGAQEYGSRFFGQGASPSGVIEVPGEMVPEKAREMASSWARRHSGKTKAHLPAVLESGATWKQTGVTNEQAQFLQTRSFTAAEIAAQMFLIDPSELGIGVDGTSLTYANLEQRATRRVQVTYLPWIVRLERALSSLIAQPRYVKLNVNGLLRGDAKTRYESYQLGIRSGFLRRSEAREFEDLPPVEGIDTEPLPAMSTPTSQENNQ